MLSEAVERGKHLQDLSQSFSLKGPTSPPIINRALGSEIKKPFRVTYPHYHSLLVWPQNVAKNKA